MIISPKKNYQFNIDTYLKPSKNTVVELDDEVEYIIDDEAVLSIKNNKEHIFLIRVIDRKIVPVELEKIKKSLTKKGPIDYLDK
ncbi:MAG TPA: hypothetical protein PLB51_00845 [Candidatus Paceibacterota bacterium]|nr:hypothetical protein [Candidatus Paceibacterota bacterium]